MIIQAKENKDVVPFKELKPGEVFKDGDNNFLIKIEEHCSMNAVWLEDGSVTSFCDNTIVVRAHGRYTED